MKENSEMRLEAETIENFIRDAYASNWELMRLETGAALSPEVKQAGLEQVLMYWRKLRDVAVKVTDTEVRLSLPQQDSPGGREFGIEGVVDIVRDGDETVMYDIKTHDADYVRSHIDLYEDQLNVYAYIWESLQKQHLDGTAVICTKLPDSLREALERGDEKVQAREVESWQPLIPIDYSKRRVEETITEFGKVVDQIEEGKFSPPGTEVLQKPYAQGHAKRFGTHVCRNCDARFSCGSYRKYARAGSGRIEKDFARYYADLEAGDPLEVWRSAGLDAAPDDEELL